MLLHGMGYMLGDATESAGWKEMTGLMRDLPAQAGMMGPYRAGAGSIYWQLHWVFELVTWALIIAVLAALVRWLWKKGGGK